MPQVEQDPVQVEETPRDLAMRAYAELGAYERDLGATQSRYRTVALAWLAGTALGALQILTSPGLALDLHPLLLLTAVGAVGALGLILMWNLDLMVSNRLLDAVLIEGLRLEQRHDHLPAVRTNMMALYGGRGVLERVWAFYAVSVSATVMLSGLSMTGWTAELRPDLVPWVALASFAVLGLTVASMRAATGHTRQLLGSIARSTRAVQARRELEAAREAQQG